MTDFLTLVGAVTTGLIAFAVLILIGCGIHSQWKLRKARKQRREDLHSGPATYTNLLDRFNVEQGVCTKYGHAWTSRANFRRCGRCGLIRPTNQEWRSR